MIILETPRLQLRRLTLTDVDDLFGIWGDAETMRFYPQPLERAALDEWFARQFKRYDDDGIGLWAVMRKSDGAFIGDCGLLIQEVDGVLETEVSYHTNKQFWGQGYAPEAARGCMKYGFNQLKRERIISMIRPENTPSRRVAEKNGLRIEKELFWHGYQHLVYVATPNE